MVSSRQNDAFALFISARESPTGPLEPAGDRWRGRSFLQILVEIEAKSYPLSGLRLLLVPIPPDFWTFLRPRLFLFSQNVSNFVGYDCHPRASRLGAATCTPRCRCWAGLISMTVLLWSLFSLYSILQSSGVG